MHIGKEKEEYLVSNVVNPQV